MRSSWDSYFLSIARTVATRATCPRKSVGAVIVRDRQIVSTGYNGSVPGAAHCTERGCAIENDHCVRTVHAEANAVAQAARNGVRLEGATVYCTVLPCFTCAKLLRSTGIERVYFAEEYGDEADRLGLPGDWMMKLED